jgi:hypothetical protein
MIKRPVYLLIFVFSLANSAAVPPLTGQEKVVGEGEHQGFIVNEADQVLKVGPIKPGQTIQVSLVPRWTAEYGKVKWWLEDQNGVRLRGGSQDNPTGEPAFVEWTSNSEPRPSAYLIHFQGMGGISAGEILGQFAIRILLLDQNDGNSGTDAPETYEKALLLPISEPGTYLFDECFISGTADVYDIYKILIRPNHSLTLSAHPVQWRGMEPKGKVRWEFLNRFFKRMKEGTSLFAQTNPFMVKVFHPRVKSDAKPALFYLLVKVDGEVSLVYAIQAEMKEGR